MVGTAWNVNMYNYLWFQAKQECVKRHDQIYDIPEITETKH